MNPVIKGCNGLGLKQNSIRMKKPVLILIIWICLIQSDSKAQILNSFLGSWEGNGTLMNNEANFEMKWEQVLNNEFFKLTFRNSIPSASFSMDAQAYYKETENGTISGYWFDSRGISFPLEGNLSDTTLTIYWGTEEIEEGRTEYTLFDSETIKVSDFVLRNGEYALFGTATYQRKK